MTEIKFGLPSKEIKPEGIYASLVGSYVRVVLHGDALTGKVINATHDTLYLSPYFIWIGTALKDRGQKVTERPAIIEAKNIQFVAHLNLNESYLDELVMDMEERNKRETYLKEKDLREKGYFDKKGSLPDSDY